MKNGAGIIGLDDRSRKRFKCVSHPKYDGNQKLKKCSLNATPYSTDPPKRENL